MSAGSAPDPVGELIQYSPSPDPRAGFMVPTSKRSEGREREGRRGRKLKGREGREEM